MRLPSRSKLHHQVDPPRHQVGCRHVGDCAVLDFGCPGSHLRARSAARAPGSESHHLMSFKPRCRQSPGQDVVVMFASASGAGNEVNSRIEREIPAMPRRKRAGISSAFHALTDAPNSAAPVRDRRTSRSRRNRSPYAARSCPDSGADHRSGPPAERIAGRDGRSTTLRNTRAVTQ